MKTGKGGGPGTGMSGACVNLYLEKKEYDVAAIIIKGMLKDVPEYSELHYVAGMAFEGKGEKDTTIMHFKRVKPESRFYQNASVQVAFLYQDQGKIEEAIRFLKDVMQIVPDNSEFLLYLEP